MTTLPPETVFGRLPLKGGATRGSSSTCVELDGSRCVCLWQTRGCKAHRLPGKAGSAVAA